MQKAAKHDEIPVKVNAWVDKGVASLVEALNSFDGLWTTSSCEGHGQFAHVNFGYAKASGSFADFMERLSVALGERVPGDNEYRLSLEWTAGGKKPLGALVVRREVVPSLSEPLVAREVEASTNGQQPRRRKRGTARSTILSTKSMEQLLWDCACSIRGEKDAPKFKDYLLPLIFIKRLSDVFDDEVQRLVETYGDKETAMAVLDADHSLVRFYLPPECRWPVVSRREQFKWPRDKTPKTLGEQLTMTVRAIAKANSKTLAGVIDIVDYNAAPHGEREISDAALSGVIETLSDPRYRLGLRDVEPDFLGRAYE